MSTLPMPLEGRPIRVLHLLDSLRVGGKERQVVELLKGLKRGGGVELMVVTMGDEQFYVPDVRALEIPLRFLLRKVRWDPMVFPGLARILGEFRPQVIHCNSEMCMLYAYPAAKAMGIKIINGTIRNAFSGRGWKWQWHMAMIRLADARIGNSAAGFGSRGLRHDGPGNHVIYNGFDLGRFETKTAAASLGMGFDPAGRTVVMMVAEFSDYKDFPTYIRAAQRVLAKRNDVVFVAVGGGKNLEACQALAGPGQGIHFLGARKDVESLVQQSDIGVLCTFTEGISNSVMEYMAAEKPVVVTDGGGSSELVRPEEHGFLVRVSDPGAVAERIEWLLDHPDRARAMGAAGRRSIAARFSLDQLAKNTLDIYRGLLADKN